MSSSKILSVILAAGESRRMGFPKPLLEYQGRSFLRHIIETHQAAHLPCCVVLGYQREEIEKRTDLSSVTVLVNPTPSRGPLSSLQIALEHAAGSSALILHPVDHPLVRSRTLISLVESHRRIPHCIVIPRFREKKGHPVLFPRRFYSDLKQAPLEQGARSVVHENLASTLHLPVEDPGILQDVDTPAEFQNLQLKLKKNFT